MAKEEKLYKVMVGGFDNYAFMVRYARLIGIDIATGLKSNIYNTTLIQIYSY